MLTNNSILQMDIDSVFKIVLNRDDSHHIKS